ncbi:MAG: SDR family oxidoreductase, partial [Usitatibacter sp.]
APGFFPTKMTKGILELLGDEIAQRAPLKRTGGPEDLKGITALFASDACSFITGQIVAVDGGVTAI